MLGFSGRVPNRYELIQWLQGPIILGHGGAVESTNYLSKGFCSVRFKEESDVSKILEKGPLLFNRTALCVVPWAPVFDSAESL